MEESIFTANGMKMTLVIKVEILERVDVDKVENRCFLQRAETQKNCVFTRSFHYGNIFRSALCAYFNPLGKSMVGRWVTGVCCR